MLWHTKTGPILTASMNEYQLIEADNMQADTDPLAMPLTPRIELKLDGKLYMNISDQSAQITTETVNNEIIIKAKSKLVDRDQASPASGDINCRVTYRFAANRVTISFDYDKTEHDAAVKFILPVISKNTEPYKLTDHILLVNKPMASTVKITSDNKLTLMPTTTKNRMFNFVPGLEAIPLSIEKNSGIITVEVV